jgi:hypothetical protein
MKTIFYTIVALLSLASAASAQTVSFGRLHDSTPGKYFDTDNATASGNVLTIPLGVGTDGTFNPNNDNSFLAASYSGTAPYYFDWTFRPRNVADTFSTFVVAPDGYYIVSITYNQTGARSTTRGSATGAMTTLTVNGVPSVAAQPEVNASLTVPVGDTAAEVVVTTALNANSGATQVTSAQLVVSVAPIQ